MARWLACIALVLGGCSAGAVEESTAPVPEGEPAAVDQVAITVTGYDDEPPRVGHVELTAPGLAAPIASCELEGQSACALRTEHRGFARLRIAAADHEVETVSIVVGAEPVAIRVKLGTADVQPDATLALLTEGSWQAHATTRDDDGILRATIASPTEIRYRVFDLTQQAGVNAPGDALVRGDDGGYWSVAPSVEGSAEIRVDTRKLPSPGHAADIRFGAPESASAQVDRIARELIASRAAYFEALKAEQRQRGTEIVEDTAAGLTRAADEAEAGPVRNAAMIGALAVQAMRGQTEPSTLRGPAARALAAIEPSDGLWSLDAAAVALALGATSDAAYATAIVERHPDAHVASAALLAQLRWADAAGDVEGARRIYTKLSDARFDQTMGRSFAFPLNPDRLIQAGKPMPPVRITGKDGAVDWTERMAGKVYVLELWATWCAGCVQAMPTMHEAYAALQPRGFEIVALSFDPDPTFVEKLRETWPMPWKHAFPTGEEQQALFEVFGAQLPRNVLVDASGTIVAVDPGWSELQGLANAALGK